MGHRRHETGDRQRGQGTRTRGHERGPLHKNEVGVHVKAEAGQWEPGAGQRGQATRVGDEGLETRDLGLGAGDRRQGTGDRGHRTPVHLQAFCEKVNMHRCCPFLLRQCVIGVGTETGLNSLLCQGGIGVRTKTELDFLKVLYFFQMHAQTNDVSATHASTPTISKSQIGMTGGTRGSQNEDWRFDRFGGDGRRCQDHVWRNQLGQDQYRGCWCLRHQVWDSGRKQAGLGLQLYHGAADGQG